ncbi:unnamed protein product [Parajaminaea phylloscopi]
MAADPSLRATAPNTSSEKAPSHRAPSGSVPRGSYSQVGDALKGVEPDQLADSKATSTASSSSHTGQHISVIDPPRAEKETLASVGDRVTPQQTKSSTDSSATLTGATSLNGTSSQVGEGNLKPNRSSTTQAITQSQPSTSEASAASYPSFSGSFVPPISERSAAAESVAPEREATAQPRKAEAGDRSSQPSLPQSSESDAAVSSLSKHLSSGSVTISGPPEADTSPAPAQELPADSSRTSGLSVGDASSTLHTRPRSSLIRRPSSAHSSHRHSAERNRVSVASSSSSFTPLRQSQSFESRLSIQRVSSLSRAASFALEPLKIRDFAFPESDPRHVGARDVSHPTNAGTNRFQLRETGADAYGSNDPAEGTDWGPSASYDEDEDEFEGDEGHDDGREGADHAGAGGTGVVPVDGLTPGLYRVLYDFEAEEEHELTVKVGELISVVGAVEGGWAVGYKEKDVEKEGLVPEGYLEWADES